MNKPTFDEVRDRTCDLLSEALQQLRHDYEFGARLTPDQSRQVRAAWEHIVNALGDLQPTETRRMPILNTFQGER